MENHTQLVAIWPMRLQYGGRECSGQPTSNLKKCVVYISGLVQSIVSAKVYLGP